MYALSLCTVLLVQIVKNQKLSYLVYIPLYGLIQLGLFYIGVYTCFYYKFPPASAIVTSAEMARVSMKIHGYFREKIINGLNKDGPIALFIPSWAQKMGVKVEDLDQP